MPFGFTIALYRFRRPIIAIAAWVFVVQALIAGVASARAAAMLADPIGGAVICHGGSDPTGPGPDQDHAWLCCGWCSTPASAAALPQLPVTLSAVSADTSAQILVAASRHPQPSRAVRAGPSQAPPTGL